MFCGVFCYFCSGQLTYVEFYCESYADAWILVQSAQQFSFACALSTEIRENAMFPAMSHCSVMEEDFITLDISRNKTIN